MPKITVDGKSGTFSEDTRLVSAIERLGVDIGHRCGGKARCTTCRVKFIHGEPDEMTEAEFDKLSERELLGQARLSCQVLCSHDMEVRPLMTLATEAWTDTGPTPGEQIEPEPVWRRKEELVGR